MLPPIDAHTTNRHAHPGLLNRWENASREPAYGIARAKKTRGHDRGFSSSKQLRY